MNTMKAGKSYEVSVVEIPMEGQNKGRCKSSVGILPNISVIISPVRLLTLKIATAVLSLVIGVGYIFLAIFVCLPSLLLRQIVSTIGHILDPDLEKLLSVNGTIPARDFADWQVAPSQSITVVIHLKGQFETIESLRSYILKCVVHRIKNDKLEYPELHQYMTKKFGYLFFKWDRDFSITNHVNVFQCPELLPDPQNTVVSDGKLTEIWEKIARRPYQSKRSAWEFLLVPNYYPINLSMEEFKNLPKEEKRSVLFLRCHHGYSDGVSIHRLLLAMTDQGVEIWEKQYHKKKKMTKMQKFNMNLYGLLCGPLALAKEIMFGMDMGNALHPSSSKKTGKYMNLKVTLQLETVKNASKAHSHVSLHSIIMASITGAIRNFFYKNGKGMIPSTPVKLGLPIPKQSHTQKLRNEYLSSYVTLPIEETNGRKRVYACEKKLNVVKNGPLTSFLTQAVSLIGGFPVELVRHLTKMSDYTVLYSEMKGPTVPLKFNGLYDIEDLYYSFGLGCDNLGVAINSLSYNGKIKLILTIDQGVCSNRQEAEALMECIQKEIEALC